jgi:hypothetical protein
MVRPERPPAFPPECFRPVLDLVTMSRSRVILALPSLRTLRRQPCYFSISHAALAARELQEDVFQREVDISAEPLML